MQKKPKFEQLLVDFILFILDILDLISDLIFIFIFFIVPNIRYYLISFLMLKILIFLSNKYSLYFVINLDLLDFYLSYLYYFIKNISIYLDFCFVMLILYSIFAKDVTLFNYLFWFFLLYLYISR
jgi:hypothetical protein